MCGEHLYVADPALGNDRSIPACAGNTIGRLQWSMGGSVHPRVCGEHHGVLEREPAPYGPSPRVRGTRQGFENFKSA